MHTFTHTRTDLLLVDVSMSARKWSEESVRFGTCRQPPDSPLRGRIKFASYDVDTFDIFSCQQRWWIVESGKQEAGQDLHGKVYPLVCLECHPTRQKSIFKARAGSFTEFFQVYKTVLEHEHVCISRKYTAKKS
ncbi:unnamed protein product [Protopolystoma xenopodis]|uniref:Uncharacterized protein n=1 Tax=Protopolystoma xenopodis TaxID=117903 RepID=A0A448XKQ3_9PLAT|nr:unnamed protein product [Protopolystoma xenopodis]